MLKLMPIQNLLEFMIFMLPLGFVMENNIFYVTEDSNVSTYYPQAVLKLGTVFHFASTV